MRPLQELLEVTRTSQGLSREALADLANECSDSGREITGRTIQFLEVECRRMPTDDILRPVAQALELDWQDGDGRGVSQVVSGRRRSQLMHTNRWREQVFSSSELVPGV